MRERIVDNDPQPRLPELVVADEGAWVTELEDADGRPILFGKRAINGKNRGGMHVCLPNFGPDAAGEFKQHGFGRNLPWKRTINDGAQVFTLDHPTRLDEAFEEYADMCAQLHYLVGETSLTTTLTVRNDSSDALPLSPGFHPYFAVGENETVRINGQMIELTAFSNAQFVTADNMSVSIGDRELMLSAGNMTKWAVWTEGDHFICIEPTLDGGDFDSSRPAHVLIPGETQTFSFVISWAS